MLCDVMDLLSGDKMTDFQEYLDEKLKGPEFRAEYDALEPHDGTVNALIKSGLSEDAIAEKTGLAKSYVRRVAVRWDGPQPRNSRRSHAIPSIS